MSKNYFLMMKFKNQIIDWISTGFVNRFEAVLTPNQYLNPWVSLEFFLYIKSGTSTNALVWHKQGVETHIWTENVAQAMWSDDGGKARHNKHSILSGPSGYNTGTRQSSVPYSAPNFVITSACLFDLIGQTKLFLWRAWATSTMAIPEHA